MNTGYPHQDVARYTLLSVLGAPYCPCPRDRVCSGYPRSIWGQACYHNIVRCSGHLSVIWRQDPHHHHRGAIPYRCPTGTGHPWVKTGAPERYVWIYEVNLQSIKRHRHAHISPRLPAGMSPRPAPTNPPQGPVTHRQPQPRLPRHEKSTLLTFGHAAPQPSTFGYQVLWQKCSSRAALQCGTCGLMVGRAAEKVTISSRWQQL